MIILEGGKCNLISERNLKIILAIVYAGMLEQTNEHSLHFY